MTKLTTHALDIYSGKPAKGLKVDAYFISDKREKIKSVVLNFDVFSNGIENLISLSSMILSSLAIPKWLKQSPLFGVMSKSNIVSLSSINALFSDLPAFKLVSNSIIP